MEEHSGGSRWPRFQRIGAGRSRWRKRRREPQTNAPIIKCPHRGRESSSQTRTINQCIINSCSLSPNSYVVAAAALTAALLLPCHSTASASAASTSSIFSNRTAGCGQHAFDDFGNSKERESRSRNAAPQSHRQHSMRRETRAFSSPPVRAHARKTASNFPKSSRFNLLQSRARH